MWITQPISTRLFVWFAAIAIPFQGLPSASCGCTVGDIFSNEISKTQSCCHSSQTVDAKPASACCQAVTTCCSASGKSGCCSASGKSGGNCPCGVGCQCGDDCRCGENNVPVVPSVPPVDNNSPERIVADSAGATVFTNFYSSSATRAHVDLQVGAHALTALACCVALCRFSL